MVAPTVYGGNHSFRRSRGASKFNRRAGVYLPPFVSVKPFVHGGRPKVAPTGMVVTIRSAVAVRLPYSIVGVGAFDDPRFKHAKLTISKHRMARFPKISLS